MASPSAMLKDNFGLRGVFSIDFRRVEGFPWIEIGAVLSNSRSARKSRSFRRKYFRFFNYSPHLHKWTTFRQKERNWPTTCKVFRRRLKPQGFIIVCRQIYVISIKSFLQAGLHYFIAVQQCMAVARVTVGKRVHRRNFGLQFITNISAWYYVGHKLSFLEVI